MRWRPSRGGEERIGGGGAVSRCDTATSQCEGGVEDGYVRRHHDKRWCEAEAAQREATRTRGKREKRRQWTKGYGASRCRGCTSRGGGGASRGGGAARGNMTTSRGEREANRRRGVSKQEAAVPRKPAGLARGQEAAVAAQRDASRQPTGVQEANGRGGTSRQEVTSS